MTVFLAWVITTLFTLAGVLFLIETTIKIPAWEDSKIIAGYSLGLLLLLAAYTFSRVAGL